MDNSENNVPHAKTGAMPNHEAVPPWILQGHAHTITALSLSLIAFSTIFTMSFLTKQIPSHTTHFQASIQF